MMNMGHLNFAMLPCDREHELQSDDELPNIEHGLTFLRCAHPMK